MGSATSMAGPQDRHRFLEPCELLSSQLLPTCPEHAKLSGAPQLKLQGVPRNQQAKMAGNSMNAACVGIFLLAAILILEQK